jgi:DNA-directed RNA polymerase subunit RPC12/RpoP
MTIYRCDKCGKRMNAFYFLAVSVRATDPWTNPADMRKGMGEYQLCRDCWPKLLDPEDQDDESV